MQNYYTEKRVQRRNVEKYTRNVCRYADKRCHNATPSRNSVTKPLPSYTCRFRFVTHTDHVVRP